MENPFHQLAAFTVARDAGFVSLAGGTLMVAFSFAPWLAFGIGANVALLFALGTIVRAARLTDEKITRTEAWRVLRQDERPFGDPGRRWARAELELLLLRSAKTASGIAIVLAGSSLLLCAR